MTRTQTIIVGTIVFLTAVFLLMVLGVLPGLKQARPAPFSLELWGFDDKDSAWQDIIQSFEKENAHISVRYTRVNKENFEATLINRLAENTGPDIFMMKNAWLIAHRDKIYPLPQPTFRFSVNTFADTFVDVAGSDLISNDGAIYGIPLSVDSLALFYNKDIFNASNIAVPPRTWDEVSQVSRALTQISPAGDITKSGIALGSAKNITHAFEIISAMILQNGDPIVSRTHTVQMDKGSEDALLFYTSFADRTKQNFTWSNLLENSLDAFAEEKTAMAIGLAYDISRMRAKNPHINIGVAPFPQLKNASKPATYADYAFLAVSKLSRHRDDAGKLILFATEKANSELYIDSTGHAPARRDILSTKAPPLEAELFWHQALIAKSWPIPDYSATKKIFEEAIESISSRRANISQAFNQLKEQLRLLLP